MRVTVFNGSPRARAGNTEVIVQAFLRGAARARAETESVYLIEKQVGHCRGCFHCWFKTPGRCVQRDDMDALLGLYCRSQIVGFASPVYTWNVTAALNNFVDRLIPLKSPVVTQSGERFDLRDAVARETAFVAIANAGFPGGDNFETIRRVFAPCNPALEIYRNCGLLMTGGGPEVREAVVSYLQCVEQAGFELVSDGAVTGATRQGLERELVSTEAYLKYLGM